MSSKNSFLGKMTYNYKNKNDTQYVFNSLEENDEFYVCDLYHYDEDLLEKRIGINVLTGDEEWFFDEKTKTYYYYQFNKLYKNVTGKYDKMLSNYFRWIEYSENIKYSEFQGGEENQIMFNFDYGKDGIDNFKKWLKKKFNEGCPVEVCYIMQSPIFIKNEERYIPNPDFTPKYFNVENGSISYTLKKYFK